MSENKQNPNDDAKVSPIIQKLLSDVFMFHWRTTAVVLPASIIVTGWFAKNLTDPNWKDAFDAGKPNAYFALVSVIILSITLIWRTFTSVTLWRLNCLVAELDSQYDRFLHDEKRFFYNALAALVTEIPLFIYNFSVLVFYRSAAYPLRFSPWNVFYYGAFLFSVLALCVWLRRHIQIYIWQKTPLKSQSVETKLNNEENEAKATPTESP